MGPQIQQTSFIPKKPGGANVLLARGGSVLSFVSLILFILSIAAAGGVYLYRSYLERQLASDQTQLKQEQDAYDPSVIDDLVKLDNRITQVKKLITAHLAPSALLSFIGTVTVESVQYTAFTYDYADGKVNLGLTGVTNSLSGVALQSDQFNATKGLSDVVFTDVTNDDKGRATFKVSMTLDPSIISYSRTISSTPTATQTQTQQTTQTTQTNTAPVATQKQATTTVPTNAATSQKPPMSASTTASLSAPKK